ncbi:MAG: MBL fold metallo-hydrolase [Desulfosudaceae bacterium]
MTAEDFVKQINWLGHDAFRIDGSRTVYFDPYQISGGPTADLILISHEHFDHCSPEDVARIQGPETMIVTDKDSAAKLSGNVRTVAPGDTVTEKDVAIEVVPSYNTDKQFHPRRNQWLGFVIELDGIRLYHAGDTDVIPEMADIRADIALLPVSGTYVMTAEEAVQAARMIKPRIAIPMHYGTVVGSDQDARSFQKALDGEIDVRILECRS